jgi:WD40 repeat protein
MRRAILGTICFLVLFTTSSALQAQIKSALGALTVSPDNKTLVAIGYNRTMYVCDPADLSVKDRVYLEIVPYEAWFSKDGKSLVVLSSDGFVNIYDAANWQRKAEIKKAKDVAIAAEKNEMFIMSGTSIRDSKRYTGVAVHDMTSGEKKREASFEISGFAIGTNPEGSQIVMLSRARTDESEKKERPPKELKGEARDEFTLRHDGRITDVLWLDGELKETHRYLSFYSDGGGNQMWIKDGTANFVSYQNRCGSFTPEGETKMFRVEGSYNYGIGISHDGNSIASGGLSTGSITNANNKTSVTFKNSRLPGFPEYYYGFTFGPDGFVYGGTSAWRIIKISPEGKILAETPIY